MQTVTIEGLDTLYGKLQSWTSLHYRDLLQGLASLVESQTRERLADEHTSPGGMPWPKWSFRYAKTRHSHHKLLQNTGHLIESIHARIEGNTAVIGTNVRYAQSQQEGNRQQHIPARKFLGVGTENQQDLQTMVDTWVAQQVTKH